MSEPIIAKTGLKALVGTQMTKKSTFMASDIIISKLTAGAVKRIQEAAALSESLADEAEQTKRQIERLESQELHDDANKLREALKADKRAEKQSYAVIRLVVGAGAEGGADLTDDEFDAFPLDELNSLSMAIMEWSGMGQDKKGK